MANPTTSSGLNSSQEKTSFLLIMVLKNREEGKGKLYQLLYHLYQMASGYAFLSAWFLVRFENREAKSIEITIKK